MFKNALKLRKLTVRELCFMAMLVAITLVLSVISGYLRIGDFAKFNVSFISVYVGGAIFGPVAGGLIAALADVISFIMNPTGAFVPVFTLMEFINGAFFGLLLYRSSDVRCSWIRLIFMTVLCTLLQFGVNMLWRTYELSRLYYGGHFYSTFFMRLPGNLIMSGVKIAAIILIEPYMNGFRKMFLKEKQ